MTNASGQFVRPAKDDGSIGHGVSELQNENKYEKDKCLESKQRIRISYEDSICRGNYRTCQGILLLRMMPQRNQEEERNNGVNLV